MGRVRDYASSACVLCVWPNFFEARCCRYRSSAGTKTRRVLGPWRLNLWVPVTFLLSASNTLHPTRTHTPTHTQDAGCTTLVGSDASFSLPASERLNKVENRTESLEASRNSQNHPSPKESNAESGEMTEPRGIRNPKASFSTKDSTPDSCIGRRKRKVCAPLPLLLPSRSTFPALDRANWSGDTSNFGQHHNASIINMTTGMITLHRRDLMAILDFSIGSFPHNPGNDTLSWQIMPMDG